MGSREADSGTAALTHRAACHAHPLSNSRNSPENRRSAAEKDLVQDRTSHGLPRCAHFAPHHRELVGRARIMKTTRQGWTGLQRRQGAEFLRWLGESKALQAGFDALASNLHALLEHRVQTKEDALKVWAAVLSVMGACDDPNTYGKPEAASAYSWLHLPDRYVRTWLTLQELVKHCLLPMGKEGVRALDVGTGPGPSAFATHDFYAAMTTYAEMSGSELWRQPARMTCVESSASMNSFRHHLAEFMAMHGAPRSVLAMCSDIGGFESVLPTEARKALNHSLRWEEDAYYDEEREQWESDLRHTPEEANEIANNHQRYRLFTFSNFLTKTSIIDYFETNLTDILNDARAGSVVVLIGGKRGEYERVREEVADLAHKAEFSRTMQHLRVSSQDAAMHDVVYAEQVRFYRRLERIAGDLPDMGNVNWIKKYFERGKAGSWGTSAIHAYRK